MNSDDEWSIIMQDHPIFTLPKNSAGRSAKREASLELSTATLPDFTDPSQDGPTPSGRRQIMVLKDADLIVAAGSEVRMTSLGESRLSQSTRKSYKTLHTPNIEFEIHQLSLNPSGKLLAVAGASQVAVIVLPRPGFTRLIPSSIECKSIQVGQFYHASTSSAPIAKIDWHPWGEAGSTLMVMTVDGKLREYDISLDLQEPTQVLSFVPERKSRSFLAEDSSEREVSSFSLGKGKADWGPLTIYAVMRSGDIYAICPYMPQNASIPSSYIHTLECFISAKQEYLSHASSRAQSQPPSSNSFSAAEPIHISDPTATLNKSLSTLYSYQHKYISALLKQLPPGTVFPSPSRSVSIHPPSTIKLPVLRQGPFLLQPEPQNIKGSEGGDATDITYLAFGDADSGGTGEDVDSEGDGTERLGVVLVSYQDGKVDVCLDVEKVEARWESKHDQGKNNDLPMLAVYETIDLGLVDLLSSGLAASSSSTSSSGLELLQGNHPLLLPDPIHDDTVYVYHAFGVHTLHLGDLLNGLANALRGDGENEEKELANALGTLGGAHVQPILSTYSVERRSSNPVVAVTIPNDVYLTYSIFILTSAMRVVSFPLNLRTESQSPLNTLKSLQNALPAPDSVISPSKADDNRYLIPVPGPPPFISLLAADPYTPSPALSRPLGLPSNPQLVLPTNQTVNNEGKKEFVLTPDTLRYFGTTVERFTAQIHEIRLAHRTAETRAALQTQEFTRQQKTAGNLVEKISNPKGGKSTTLEEKSKQIMEVQKGLLGRLDRVLQGMMQRASPELSEHEVKWFEELKRLKGEVVGSGKYDQGSLSSRIALLEREYARIMPALKTLLEKEILRKKKVAEANQGLGFSQIFELGERSTVEKARIASLEADVTRLASKLDMSLGRPPSQSR